MNKSSMSLESSLFLTCFPFSRSLIFFCISVILAAYFSTPSSPSSSSSTSDCTTKGKGEVAPPKLLRLQSAADYTVDESFAVDTRDHEDHTFCGIMFDLIVKDLLPVQYLEVDKTGLAPSISCRYRFNFENFSQDKFSDTKMESQGLIFCFFS